LSAETPADENLFKRLRQIILKKAFEEKLVDMRTNNLEKATNRRKPNENK
jgi:hypothetical protein